MVEINMWYGNSSAENIKTTRWKKGEKKDMEWSLCEF
jgi:hypothetical protein